MSSANFLKSLKLVLASEGGNDDDPADHGGRTSRGITQHEYNAWLREQKRPPFDVWHASQSDIETIYHDEYWEPYCDGIPIGLDYIYFNNCVLDGPYRSTVLLQRSLGVNDDGRFGPVTRQAVNKADPASTVIKLSNASKAFYKSLHQPRFLNGWLNRVANVEQNALKMIRGMPA